jgi:orotate phosphoribosyltransferase
MESTEKLRLFQDLGVLSQGHFLLSSGRHSDEYWEKFRLLEHPQVTEQLCEEMAGRYRDAAVSAVVGPTTGGGLIAQEVGRQLGARCLIAEPAAGGGRELRRGFVIQPGERVLVVDDVLTTGLSLSETLEAIKPYQPEILGIEVLIDRSNHGKAGKQFGLPFQALFSAVAHSYDPVDCPLCRAGQPVVKPGTRKQPGQF